MIVHCTSTHLKKKAINIAITEVGLRVGDEIAKQAGDRTGKPNLKCKYCHGTGMVTLATSSKKCLDC